MGFKQFKQALEAEIEPEETTDITFEEVTEVCPEILSADGFYFEMLGGQLPHRRDGWLCLGKFTADLCQIRTSVFCSSRFSKNFWKIHGVKVYDFKTL